MLADHQERGVDLGDFTREVETSTGVSAKELTSRGASEYDSLMRRVRGGESIEVGVEFEELRETLVRGALQQIEGLRNSGVIVESRPGFEGYTALMLSGDHMAMRYVTPGRQDIVEVLDRHREVVAEKSDQGFNRLLAVPSLAPVSVMVDAFMRRLQRASALGTLKGLGGEPFELIESGDNWRSLGRIFTEYERHQANYPAPTLSDGIDKYEQREQLRFRGWEFFLVQDPEVATTVTDDMFGTGQRTPLAAGWSAIDCINQLSVGGVYEHEVGYTPHVYFAHAMRELQRRQTVFDTKTETLLFGSVLSMPDGTTRVMRLSMTEKESGSKVIKPRIFASEPTREAPTAYGRTAVRLL